MLRLPLAALAALLISVSAAAAYCPPWQDVCKRACSPGAPGVEATCNLACYDEDDTPPFEIDPIDETCAGHFCDAYKICPAGMPGSPHEEMDGGFFKGGKIRIFD